MGNGIVCQVDNCGAVAYQHCNFPMPCTDGYSGCGKAMCMAHCEIIKTKKSSRTRQKQSIASGPYNLSGYHCKSPECVEKYGKGKKKICMFLCIPVIVTIIIVAVILAVTLSGETHPNETAWRRNTYTSTYNNLNYGGVDVNNFNNF